MTYKFLIFATVLLTVIVIHNVYGIKCWECRSDSDQKCADPFDNSSMPIADCSKAHELDHLPGVKATMCRKIRQKVNGVWRYIRSCAFMGEPGINGDERYCLGRTGTYNIFIEYCTCNTKDGCNVGSQTNTKSGLLMILSVSLACLTRLRIFA